MQRKRRRRTALAAGYLPPLLEKTVGKRELKQAISWTLNTYGPDRTKQLLDDMKELGFGWATRAGISLGVDDMSVPEQKTLLCDSSSKRTLEAESKYENGDITVVEKFIRVTEEWSRTSEQVKDAAISNFKNNDPNNPVYMMSTSGARGNISQVRQLLAMRGLMADANGQLIDVPIQHCLREGMTVTDMLISGHGARKGVIDTALRTADSGYLYRRLDFAASSVVVQAHDCGTKTGLPIFLHGSQPSVASMKDRLRGRVLAQAVVHPQTQEVLYGADYLLNDMEAAHVQSVWKECEKTMDDLPPVHVRSVLACKLKSGVCAKCYGEDLSTPGKLVVLGHPSGTIAAQSMGEPGTQLTMRTFHTGGAFEGSAGEGIQAAHRGTVRLRSQDGQVISGPSQEIAAVSEWKRTPQGDVCCVLATAATLEIVTDGQVTQQEDLLPGSSVKALEGAHVTFGQVLYEKPAKVVLRKPEDKDVERLAKPIKSDEGGEVIVQEADAKAGCLESSARLVWVLQGTCLNFEQGSGCTVSVKSGDFVGEGVPLAQEWASTRTLGVPRFQVAPNSSSRDSDSLSLRTDFDWFFLGGENACQYMASCEVPKPLKSGRDLSATLRGVYKKMRAAVERSTAGADEERLGKIRDAEPVPVYTWATGTSSSSSESPAVGTICAPPSKSHGSLIYPISRAIKPEYIVPTGGLVLHLPGKSRAVGVLWCPEEDASEMKELSSGDVDDAELVDRSLRAKHERLMGPGRPLFHKVPTKVPLSPEFVEEAQGVLVRKARDTVYLSKGPTLDELVDLQSSWQLSFKPGKVFFAPSKYFSEGSWYELTECEDGTGVSFNQKMIPPGVSIIPELPSAKLCDHWRVVEILDDPRSTEFLRVLVRHTRHITLPEAEIRLPHQSRTSKFWSVSAAHGEVVKSDGPVVLVREIMSSMARHPAEPHCATVVPAGPPDVLHGDSPAFDDMSLDVSLRLDKEWRPGDLCAVQHSPLGPARRCGGGSAWTDAEPQHVLPTAVEEEERPMACVTRRQRPSQVAGVVCRAEATNSRQKSELEQDDAHPADDDAKRSIVVILRPQDVVQIPCTARPTVAVGNLVRLKGAVSENEVAPCSGQVLAVEEAASGNAGKAAFVVTLRKGRVYLVSDERKLLVQTGAVVQQGDALGTDDLLVPKTTDIVQGLPRITRLFEVSGPEHQAHLDEIWEKEKQHADDLAAALLARSTMQLELVEELQSAYGSQGVSINSKHIEVLVKTMTDKCEILESASSAFAVGSIVDYRDIEAMLALQPSGAVRARPLIRGITDVGKDGHVLVSMGFREVDNMLSSAVLNGKSQFPMNGIKENLMIGKAISVGSGYGKKTDSFALQSSSQRARVDLSKIPELCTKRK